MRRLLGLPVFYLLLAGASCPGPEPFDCAVELELEATRAAKGGPAPYFKVRLPEPDRYIVTLRPGAVADLQADAGAASADAGTVMADLATGYGAGDVETYEATSQFSGSLTREELRALRADGRVLFVEQNGVKKVVPLAGDETAADWGLDRIDQRDLPLDGVFEPDGTGLDIHAYVIDTGVDSDHPDFAGRLGEGFNAIGDTRDDDNGHGTHVAGTMAGTTFGVARAAIIHPVRVLRRGEGTDANVIDGIDWVTAHVQTNGWPAVANMSLGGDTSKSLDTALCRSIAAGVVHVVAAGNDGGNACSGSPAHVAQAITVGATDRRDRTARFSNQGKCVDVFAPGVNVKSSWHNGRSRTISGTSMASPHVAGVAVLALENDPQATPAELEGALLGNATPGVVRDVDKETTDQLIYAKDQ